MITDKFKKDIAAVVSQRFESLLPEIKASDPDLYIFNTEHLYKRIGAPKNSEMGTYALPLFDLAKILQRNPVELCQNLVESLNAAAPNNDMYSHLSYAAVGGFCNIKVKDEVLAQTVISEVLLKSDEYGSSDVGQKNRIVIDFSSPNIAKPFGVQHLRSTAIGAALHRVYDKLGYEPVGINHLGDWGTQFGKLIVAHRLWNDEGKETDPIKHLFNLYVRFHNEEEEDDSLGDKAREAFKALEDGEQDEAELWMNFREVSLDSFRILYSRLNVLPLFYELDKYGESFYNDKMDEAVGRIKNAGLTEISDGALIVNLDKYNLPPCLLAKADGATLYATRDIAGIMYRWHKFDFEKALYVVGSAQRDHFQQVFRVIELLEEAENVPAEKRITGKLEHIEFGWIRFKDKKMSTRKGEIIFLEDVLDKAASMAHKLILEKNPDLADIDQTAEMIGVGAVIFADLSTRKHIDVNFDWDQVLSFEGETGPYLQYTHARLCSLLRKYGKDIGSDVDYSVLSAPEEIRVLELLYKFPFVIQETAHINEPYMISQYLLELGSAFNRVYQRKDKAGRIVKLVADDEATAAARMALVRAMQIVIKEGLILLGIDAPKEM